MAQRLIEVTDPELRQRLQTAADESTAMAWMTAYPLLVLPELFEESGRLAQYRLERQRTILRGGRPQTCLAA